MDDGTAGIAEARVHLHQVGRVRHLIEPAAPDPYLPKHGEGEPDTSACSGGTHPPRRFRV